MISGRCGICCQFVDSILTCDLANKLILDCSWLREWCWWLPVPDCVERSAALKNYEVLWHWLNKMLSVDRSSLLVGSNCPTKLPSEQEWRLSMSGSFPLPQVYIYIISILCIYIYLSFFNPISSKKSKKNIPSFTRVRVPSLLQWSKDLPRSVSWADPDLGRTSSFNPFEKYSSFWIISPNFRGENKTNVWNHHHQSKIENVQPYQVCSGQVSKQACAIPKSAKPVLRASVELV